VNFESKEFPGKVCAVCRGTHHLLSCLHTKFTPSAFQAAER